jgi:chromosome segregation ATPase
MRATDIPPATISKAKISKWITVGRIFLEDSHRSSFCLCIRIELVELETALNDIEKAMDKIETQNSNIQNKLRDLLESNRQVAKEFTEIRRGMTTKLKEVTQQMEQAPGIAQDLAAVTSETLSTIEQDMSSTNDTAKFK